MDQEDYQRGLFLTSLEDERKMPWASVALTSGPRTT